MLMVVGHKRKEREVELEVSFLVWFDLPFCLADSRLERFFSFDDFFLVAILMVEEVRCHGSLGRSIRHQVLI